MTSRRVSFISFFFSSRRRHTRSYGDWSSDVCSSDLAVRDLDVARIESLVVKQILGAETSTPIVRYVADANEALAMVQRGGAAVAVLLNATRVDQVFAVADAGDVMPPRSTYFVPKVPSGLVLRPLT